jgi:1,2-dihydroxy-3-keto-5-methylthiopentene dioxygenase
MSALVVYAEDDAERVLSATGDPAEIAERLAPEGVRFERWSCGAPLPPSASQEEILAAYRADVERLRRERGYQSADVVRLAPDSADPGWPDKARAARLKFLEEHWHNEDEVRFFVEGSGLFVLHVGGRVLLVLCERGDLLSVPAQTRHWFDMGSEPRFCAIRLFGTPDGWLASFTGDAIARRFPSYDQVAAQWR